MHPDPGWWNHLYWWWEIHTGTQNEGGPYYGALSGWVGDIGLITIAAASIAALVHTIRRHQCYETTCHKIARHTYEIGGVTHPVCHVHHPALGADHVLTHAHMLAHHAKKAA